MKSLQDALRFTFTGYAVILIKLNYQLNRQICNYTALIAAYKSNPPNGGSNLLPLALLASVLSTTLPGPRKKKKN
jgi:hypothetical protein